MSQRGSANSGVTGRHVEGEGGTLAHKPVVFVGRDHALDAVLGRIAEALERQGCRVIRGWPHKPPQPTEYPPDSWADLFAPADVIIISTRTRCPRPLLEAASRLRAVLFVTIGTESIDLADAADLGIVVGNGATPESFLSMAEANAMLICNLLINLAYKERLTRLNLPRPGPLEIPAQMVRGKTIGFVGFGRISRATVERLSGWGTHFLTTDPYVAADTLPPGVRRVDLPTLLAESDVVDVQVTLTPETRHMIGAAEIARMKPTAYLINASRGGVVDESALVDALKTRRIAGAALDVFEKEPLPADHPLREFDNVILTSHIVGHSAEGNSAFIPAAVESVARVLRGEPPVYVRNPDVLPAWRDRVARLDRTIHASS
jgi:phosphoglycerate dehydrogenase-like enzyme